MGKSVVLNPVLQIIFVQKAFYVVLIKDGTAHPKIGSVLVLKIHNVGQMNDAKIRCVVLVRVALVVCAVKLRCVRLISIVHVVSKHVFAFSDVMHVVLFLLVHWEVHVERTEHATEMPAVRAFRMLVMCV